MTWRPGQVEWRPGLPESTYEQAAREANEFFGCSWITSWTVARAVVSGPRLGLRKYDHWILDRLAELEKLDRPA